MVSDQRLISNILLLALLVLCGLIVFWTGDMTPGAELFPRMVATAMAVFVVAELLRSGIPRRHAQEGGMRVNRAARATDDGTSGDLARKSAIYMGAFFVAVMAFFLLFPIIGFELAAILFMLGAMALLGGRRALRPWVVGVGVAVPLVLVLVFRVGLQVRLPTLPWLG